jgi:hypothetical protein
MTKTEYALYLQSPHWQTLRRELLEGQGYGAWCARCDIPRWLAEIAYDQDLHVHHKTYENLGAEENYDLEILCRRCHEIETFGRSELRAVKKAVCKNCNDTHWDYRSFRCRMCEAIIEGHSNFNSAILKKWRLVASRISEFIDAKQFSKEEFDAVISEADDIRAKSRAEWAEMFGDG